jgi:hypothetical protein
MVTLIEEIARAHTGGGVFDGSAVWSNLCAIKVWSVRLVSHI